jgi:hypothetical protein
MMPTHGCSSNRLSWLQDKLFNDEALQGSFRAVVASGLAYAALLQPDIRFHVASALGSVLRLADPETAHRLTIEIARLGLTPRDSRPDDPRLHIKLWGRTFTNPLGIAAGFDKDAEAMDAIMGMGLGFMEVGERGPLVRCNTQFADAMIAHARCNCKLGLVPQDSRPDDPRLRIMLWGRTFTNPLCIAAGFDKDAEVMDAIMGMWLRFM